jgi:hypothetical protein
MKSGWDVLCERALADLKASPDKTRRLEIKQVKKELQNVKKQEHSHGTCWLFQGRRDRDGYARTTVQRKDRILSRLILCLTTDKPYKSDLIAGHKTPLLCKTGNRNCINPDHLQWETKAEGAARRERDEHWLSYRKEHCGTAEDAGVLEARETARKLTRKERG